MKKRLIEYMQSVLMYSEQEALEFIESMGGEQNVLKEFKINLSEI